MATKSEYLQIRVTPAEKDTLERRADRAGQSLSAYVLSRALPRDRARFEEIVCALARGEERRAFVFAELNDLLSDLPGGEMEEILAEPDHCDLSALDRNYVAAMIEQASYREGVDPPAWTRNVEPLDEPHFATELNSLRLHLLKASPVAFKRRNIFVDSSVGDRV